MNPQEPSLYSHLNEARADCFAEGGLTSVIYCGKIRTDVDLTSILYSHRTLVEDEVNTESANITGILIVQVTVACQWDGCDGVTSSPLFCFYQTRISHLFTSSFFLPTFLHDDTNTTGEQLITHARRTSIVCLTDLKTLVKK